MNNISTNQLLNTEVNPVLETTKSDILIANEDQRATVRLHDIDVLRQTANNLLKADKQLKYDDESGETKGISFDEISTQLTPENLNLAPIVAQPSIKFSNDPDNDTKPNVETFLPTENTLGISKVNIQTKPLERRIVDTLTPADLYIGGDSDFTLGYDSAIYSGIGEIAIKNIAINHSAEYIVTQEDVEVVGGKNEINLDLTSDGQYFGASQITLSVPLVNNKVFTVNANNLGATLTPAGETINLDGTPTSEGGYSPLGYREITLKADLTQLSAATISDYAKKRGGTITPGGLSIGYDRVSIPDISRTYEYQGQVTTVALPNQDGEDPRVGSEDFIDLTKLSIIQNNTVTIGDTTYYEDSNKACYRIVAEDSEGCLDQDILFNCKDFKRKSTPLYQCILDKNQQIKLVNDYYQGLNSEDKEKIEAGNFSEVTPMTTYYNIYSRYDSETALGHLKIPQIPVKSLNIKAQSLYSAGLTDEQLSAVLVAIETNTVSSLDESLKQYAQDNITNTFFETIQNHNYISDIVNAINRSQSCTIHFDTPEFGNSEDTTEITGYNYDIPRCYKDLTLDLSDRSRKVECTIPPIDVRATSTTYYLTANGELTDTKPWTEPGDIDADGNELEGPFGYKEKQTQILTGATITIEQPKLPCSVEYHIYNFSGSVNYKQCICYPDSSSEDVQYIKAENGIYLYEVDDLSIKRFRFSISADSDLEFSNHYLYFTATANDYKIPYIGGGVMFGNETDYKVVVNAAGLKTMADGTKMYKTETYESSISGELFDFGKGNKQPYYFSANGIFSSDGSEAFKDTNKKDLLTFWDYDLKADVTINKIIDMYENGHIIIDFS